MEFTSGGTRGPRFDSGTCDRTADLGNNVYGSLPSAQNALHAAQGFHRAGWRVRKSGWTDFEVETTYAQLELTAHEPVLFSGIVVLERIEDLLSAFAAIGLRHRTELYDEDGELIAEYASDVPR